MNRRDFLKTSAAGIGVAVYHASLAQELAIESAGKTLVLGGTALACGAVYAHPERVVVLERGIHLVPEFALTNGSPDFGEPRTDAGRTLARRMEACGLLKNNRLQRSALPDFFAEYITGRGGSLLLNAELADLEKTARGFRATIGGIDGLSSFSVARVLDTTAEGWQDFGHERIAARSISAILRGRPPTDALPHAEGVSLCEGDRPDEMILRVALPTTASWHEARLRLHAVWDSMRTNCPELKLAAESPALAYSYRGANIHLAKTDGPVWHPSAQYENLVTAFEEGLSCDCR